GGSPESRRGEGLYLRAHPSRLRRRRPVRSDAGGLPPGPRGQRRAPLPADGRAGAGQSAQVGDGSGRRRPPPDVAAGRAAPWLARTAGAAVFRSTSSGTSGGGRAITFQISNIKYQIGNAA